MKQYLVKIKVFKFMQFYVVNKKELTIIKQLDYFDEGGCCDHSGWYLICQLGGCRFKYQNHIEITCENEDFVSDTYYTLLEIIDTTKKQHDYDDQKELKI